MLDLRALHKHVSPLPIIFPAKRLVLLFSAKAGSTFAVKWFFYQMGLLDQANEYSDWVHDYRLEIYYASQGYPEQFMAFLQKKYWVIKCVRDPFKRAVSSYIHALKNTYEDKHISRFLKRPINRDNSFSFREFVGYLETLKLGECNIHHRRQVELLELNGTIKIDELVKLTDSSARIAEIEKKYDLSGSQSVNFKDSPHHIERHEEIQFCCNDYFSRNNNNLSFPRYTYFFDIELEAIIARLYEEDFRQYDYPCVMPRLATKR
jgi:Sulfotransferase family